MKRYFSVFCFCLLVASAFSQTTSQEYVIVSIDDKYKKSQHGVQTFFWIIPTDSISSLDCRLSRLFLSDFSVNNFSECCSGNATDPLVVTQTSNFILDNDFLSRLDLLKKTILKNRKKVQTVTKKWEDGQTETITVFITAITGEFCHCKYHPIGQQRTGYAGNIYLPKSSSFRSSDAFWKTSTADFMKKRDYSKFHFDIIPN